jgi:hypothetical protein
MYVQVSTSFYTQHEVVSYLPTFDDIVHRGEMAFFMQSSSLAPCGCCRYNNAKMKKAKEAQLANQATLSQTGVGRQIEAEMQPLVEKQNSR